MKAYLREKITAALASMGITAVSPVSFEKPRQAGHGDLTTNIAMLVAKQTGRKSRELAAEIAARLDPDPSLVAGVEVAGPGFINFSFTGNYYLRQLEELVRTGDSYGRSALGKGRKVQVEFVSARLPAPVL